jgi:hypothetical protein
MPIIVIIFGHHLQKLVFKKSFSRTTKPYWSTGTSYNPNSTKAIALWSHRYTKLFQPSHELLRISTARQEDIVNMSSTAAEKKVKKLARLPSNTVCANCGTTKKFGFSTVCIKYFTFVCNNCKSSHQAISHRCKSLTMSSWTDQEAAELQKKGNDYARRTWLKNAPPVGQGGRPREGDSVDVFKRFVVDAYERKRYYGEDDGNVGAGSARPTPVVAADHAPRVAARAPVVARAPVRKAAPPPAPPPPAPVADLLDFTSMSLATPHSGATNNTNTNTGNTFEANFDAFAPAAPVPASGPSTGAKTVAAPIKIDPFQSSITKTAAVSNGSSSTTFAANFDAFAPAASVPLSGPSTDAKTAATPIENDPFQSSFIKPISASNGSSFNFMNNNNIMAASSPAPTAPAPPAIKKSVMNNQNMSQKSSLISSMSMSAAPSNIQQGHHNMGMGMGWNNNSSNNNPKSFGGLGNMQSQQHQMMMQQQQMNMMNGMCMNNSNMGVGMMNNNNNPMMMMGNNNNPMMMMGNNNNQMMMMGNNNNQMMMMGNNNNQMMMNQQHTMMNGNNFGGMTNNSTNGKSKGNMQSLQMNSSSMDAWSSGLGK